MRVPRCQVAESGNPKGAFADAFFQPGLHPPHNRGVEPNPSHQHKVTSLVRRFISREAKIYAARLATRGDCNRLFIIKRQTEFTRENVCCPTRNDSEARRRSGQTLDCFVDGSVATRDDHVSGTIASGARGNLRSITWSTSEF